MILDLRQPITTDIVLHQITRDADCEFHYADPADEASIVDAVREMARIDFARKRLATGDGK